MRLKIFLLRVSLAVALTSLSLPSMAQQDASPPIKCKYAFEDYRIYCLALKDAVLISSVTLEGADTVWCSPLPMVSLPSQNNFAEKLYDKGEVIRINLGARCSIHAYTLSVGGKSYKFNAD